jgi:glycosyltransferase involved in cell wall biosynthesis
MNILYMTYDGLTDALGQSQVLPYLTGLSKRNHNIIILSCEKKNNYYKQSSVISKQLSALNIENRELKTGSVKWVPISYTSKPAVVSTIYDIIRIYRNAKRICKENDIQIIHCRSYITAIAGLSLKKKHNIKHIFDMRGFFADERVEGGIWNLKNPIYSLVYKYFKYKEKQFFREADHVISLTENGKNEILKMYEVRSTIDDLNLKSKIENLKSKITVIPCCVDLKLFSESSIKADDVLRLKEKLDIKDNSIVLSYLGSIGTWYMLDEMLAFFKRLLIKHPDAKFLFITPEKKEYIIKKAGNIRIPETSITVAEASRNQIPVYLKLSNISIFFIKPVFSKRASSPTKQGEVMSMGIPIICNADVGDTDKIIRETGTGYVIKNFNDTDYDEAIDDIENLIKIPGERIIQTAEKYYSLEKGIEKYDKIYKTVASKQ